MSTEPRLDAGACPLCQSPNACALAQNPKAQHCWCQQQKFSQALLDQCAHQACICQTCAAGERVQSTPS